MTEFDENSELLLTRLSSMASIQGLGEDLHIEMPDKNDEVDLEFNSRMEALEGKFTD